MAHPWHHALLSARRNGGTPEDYLAIHTWLDYTKSHIPDCRHRLFLHNSWGLFVAERILGTTFIRPSDGQVMPLRPLLEKHITEDFARIPTLATCLEQLPVEPVEEEVTSYEQSLHSAEKWGGTWSDYQPLHQFLDWPREQISDGRQRRIFHNIWGVAMTEQAFGNVYTRPSDGARLPVRAIAEEHIRREVYSLPTLEDSLEGIVLQRWMCVKALPIHLSLK